MTTWLITWDWIGDHARMDEGKKVVAVLNYRLGSNEVRELVEQLYMASEYSDREKIEIALNMRPNPYVAEFEKINGVPRHGEVRCGHNPHLYARKVRNLRVVVNDEGLEQALWDEMSRRDPPS